ncbi:MAG TPA: tRNA pseudouridine(38-40) synthase TruA [Verrucomicrobiae bacterium]|nr:tRNA pseudouridine(38-40) synthase TruA [Verrucomicrobiae bacterium]
MPRTRLQPKNRRHFKLTIAYDGTNYAGWQLQPNGRTIQEAVEGALAKIAGAKVRVHGSGRTDAGVHARGQVANVSFGTQLAPGTLRRALNANLPEDIRVQHVQEADARFHARFSAKGKEYRYQIDCGAAADPFLRAYAWHHPRPLDVAAMRQAARLLKGRHDFAALSANPMRDVETTVRTISKLSVTKRGGLVTITVVANGFLYKMVRSIVGALVKVGEGRMTVEQLQNVVKAKKRTALVETAPAHGLFLWRVDYGRPGSATAAHGSRPLAYRLGDVRVNAE